MAPRSRLDDRPATVYMVRDSQGEVIYVGCTTDLDNRMAAHRKASAWYPEMAAIETERHPDRQAGLDRERQLIYALQPKRNRTFTRPMLDEYLAGATYREIADAHGITRQAVQQQLAQEAPSWLLTLERERRKARTRTRRAAAEHRRYVEAVRLCHTCGGAIPQGARAAARTCPGECRELWWALSQHLPGHGRMQRLKGKGRWLIAGSAADRAARVCHERGYPLFERLPEGIRAQVRGGRQEQAAHPCEACGSMTDNPRFCSLPCYRSSGLIGRAA